MDQETKLVLQNPEQVIIHEKRLVLQNPEQAVIRMYGQGFGDCFLLAFPRQSDKHTPDPENPVYVVIDSGVHHITPGEEMRMRMVARSIQIATGGTIDLLVATHEHYDHLCGFAHAAEIWKEISVRQVWVAWTEDPENEFTKQYDHEREAMERQSRAAQRKLSRLMRTEKENGREFALVAELNALLRLAEFGLRVGGEDEDILTAAAALDRAPRNFSKRPHEVLTNIARDPGKIFKKDEINIEVEFCTPGQVLTVPGSGIDAYVLGPPTDAKMLGLDMDEDEVYSQGEPGIRSAAPAAPEWDRLALATAATRAVRMSVAAALDAEPGTPDRYTPFKAGPRVPLGEANQYEFFAERYFNLDEEMRIDNEWLRGVGQLALQVDNLTNNTSLVLAFRLPDDRVLLFVGDAQVGNWLSWESIEPDEWKRPNGDPVDYRPTARDLLGATAVYKVGHHGSHNATLRKKGLEQMPNELIAFIPASRNVPQTMYDWNIPLPTLLTRLKKKTDGRIVLPYEDTEYSSSAFRNLIDVSKAMLPPMVNSAGKKLEDSVPLWRQVRI